MVENNGLLLLLTTSNQSGSRKVWLELKDGLSTDNKRTSKTYKALP